MSYNASFVSALKEALNGLKTIHQVGEEWVSYVGDIPTGGVPYCGQEVNRETYSALWSYAQAKGLVKSESEWQSLYASQGGNVAFYSSGNGSSTFRMPRLVGYVRGASSQSESGSYVKEGLPNITSKSPDGYGLDVWTAGDTNQTVGAIKITQSSFRPAGAASYGTFCSIDFDANRCSSLYGNSDHVTPETSVVLYGVYAFGEIGNASSLDAATLASAIARVESNMNGFVRSVNNIIADDNGNVNVLSSFGIDTSSSITRTIGTTYTATRNCWVYHNQNANANCAFYVNGIRVYNTDWHVNHTSSKGSALVFVAKGQTYKAENGPGVVEFGVLGDA